MYLEEHRKEIDYINNQLINLEFQIKFAIEFDSDCDDLIDKHNNYNLHLEELEDELLVYTC